MTVFHGLSAFSITSTDQAGVVDAPALAVMLTRIQEAGADSIGLPGSTGRDLSRPLDAARLRHSPRE